MSSAPSTSHLRAILSRANKHYAHVAALIRASINPTHHARKRAHRIGLTVDVRRAVACDPKQVSNVPLPIIENAPSPTLATIRRYAHELTALHGRPRARQPTALTRTSPNGTTCTLAAAEAYTVDVSMNHDAPDVAWHHLDVPVDIDAVEWDMDLDEDDSDASDPSSAASSVGPETPIEAPVVVRLKRKSVEAARADDCEKRPRFDRGGWEQHDVQRRNVIRIPTRR